MKTHIHIARWSISFTILALYTSFLITTDSRIVEYRAEAKNIVIQQKQTPLKMFEVMWQKTRICARTNRGNGCGRAWFIYLPVIIHIS